MAINQNHLFEDINGIKCAVVEKNVSYERANFLKVLLEYNSFTVLLVPSALPKASAPAPTIANDVLPVTIVVKSFTVGVTDVMFNATNAIFGRLLQTPNKHIVTLAYWNQKEIDSKDMIPYYENV